MEHIVAHRIRKIKGETGSFQDFCRKRRKNTADGKYAPPLRGLSKHVLSWAIIGQGISQKNMIHYCILHKYMVEYKEDNFLKREILSQNIIFYIHKENCYAQ